jgi:hypothetical protein
MVIDVISYTEAQYASLTDEQIVKIQNVQLKKNRLAKQLEEDKREAKYKLIKEGIFRSPIWDKLCAALTEEYESEVENLHDELMFYLQFTGKEEESETAAAYTLDYSLSYSERLRAVRAYYDETYPNAKEKFKAFVADKVAKNYLGEYYAPLYELYSADAEEA